MFINKLKHIFRVKENIDEITIIYKIDNNNNNIKVFDERFVKINKKICKIIYDGKTYDLNEYINIDNIKLNKDIITIKFKGISKISDIGYMFCYCTSLLEVPDIDKINTINIKNFESLFDVCTSLISLPDISNWNTSNVTNMSGLFNNCRSIKSLPDISKWNTGKVTDISYMFSNCFSLLSLPNIQKWNISNVTDMNNMFSGCISLSSIPDISKWNTNNLIYM